MRGDSFSQMASGPQGITERLTGGLRLALARAALPALDDCLWEVPRDPAHGDYATNAAMTLARSGRRPPRQIAELIVGHFPAMPEIERLDVAGPGFINVALAPDWCREALHGILSAGDAYGRGDEWQPLQVRLEFVSANPTGPLVIVNARAAAVGDALARILRARGACVVTEYYVNDAGNQFEALARSFEARVRQALGEDVPLPDDGYPGEYLTDLARDYVAAGEAPPDALAAADRVAHFGRYAVDRIVAGQRRVLSEYGVEFDRWSSEQRDVRDAGLPCRAIDELTRRQLTYEDGEALWFRSSRFGDEKDRVLRKSTGELTYFAVDVGFHHFMKFDGADRVITLIGPDHHGYVERMRAAMQALGHPADGLEILIIQLVTLLRDGQPVRMSKRQGEFVLMKELLDEVGRDAARFTFLMRRHDSPLEFDLTLATRQSAENPVYYVQYAHARIASIFKQAAASGIAPRDWDGIDLAPLTAPEELALIKRLLQYPAVVAGAARALEPHRLAYWLSDLAGAFHPYYKTHRVIGDDASLTMARLALCGAVGQVARNGLGLLGVAAPTSM
jgi:arginyl-tRNA synthetase